MIDLHSHLLPGLDDGARNLDQAMSIVRAMAADGVRAVAATPHVRDDWPTTPREMEEAVAALRTEVERAGVPLEVLRGGELALDELARLDETEQARFGLGGNPRLLLLEFPYWGWPLGLAQTVRQLAAAGIVSVIAHPERNGEVQERPDRLDEIVRAGAVWFSSPQLRWMDGWVDESRRARGLFSTPGWHISSRATPTHRQCAREVCPRQFALSATSSSGGGSPKTFLSR